MTTFNAAFAAARKEKGAGKTFTWNGKLYTTDRADDPPKGKEKKEADKGGAKASQPKQRSAPAAEDKPPKVMSEAPAFPDQPKTERLRRVGVGIGELTPMVRKALDRADKADANKTRDDLTKEEWDKLQDRRKKSRGARMYRSV